MRMFKGRFKLQDKTVSSFIKGHANEKEMKYVSSSVFLEAWQFRCDERSLEGLWFTNSQSNIASNAYRENSENFGEEALWRQPCCGSKCLFLFIRTRALFICLSEAVCIRLTIQDLNKVSSLEGEMMRNFRMLICMETSQIYEWFLPRSSKTSLK